MSTIHKVRNAVATCRCVKREGLPGAKLRQLLYGHIRRAARFAQAPVHAAWRAPRSSAEKA